VINYAELQIVELLDVKLNFTQVLQNEVFLSADYVLKLTLAF
jgi:hypothetical protein